MRIGSSAFPDGARIPRRYTCDGENVSPPLAFSDVPGAAASLVLLCEDPDAPGGTWHHWGVYNMAADLPGLKEAILPTDQSLLQAVNDFGRVGYGGPCPPHGHGPHHYQFRLLALSVAQLAIPQKSSCRELGREARKHLVAEATLVGVYDR